MQRYKGTHYTVFQMDRNIIFLFAVRYEINQLIQVNVCTTVIVA